MTIWDGTGRALSGPSELLAEEPELPREGRRLDRHRLGALAMAAAAGFALATMLAELRTTTIEESAGGALSFEARLDDGIRPGITGTGDDGRALTMPVILRNTGPRPVALERIELLDTPYRSDDLSGRHVAAGGETTIVLLRSIDCARLESPPAPGALRVHATTSAGERSVDVRMPTLVMQFQDDQVRAACGRADPDEALYVQDGRDSLDGSTMVVDLALRNGSSRPLAVERLVPATGLRMTSVTTRSGTPFTLPLLLEAGDFDPPVDPFFGGGPTTELSIRLAVEDCDRFEPPTSYDDEAAVTLWVTGGRYPHAFGVDPDVQQRLHDAVCGSSS